MKWKFQFSGTNGSGHAWTIDGIVQTPGQGGSFEVAIDLAKVQAFNGLMRGRANFADPATDCGGPYQITRMTIETWEQEP
jgi:hypothetical protein